MKYKDIYEGIFLERPHRFGAMVEIDKQIEYVHVKNTGRCKELLISGVKVYLEKSNNPKRKTKFSLISVEKGNLLINIDSQVPNSVIEDSIRFGLLNEFMDISFLQREKTFGNSRFDLYFERENGNRGFIEVKGVTLDVDGTAMFPDAPTVRGTKHLIELSKAVTEGYEAFVVFLIQYSPVNQFIPNYITDPVFTNSLKKVCREGVKILAYDSVIGRDSIILGNPVEIRLAQNI